jgi:uncharacterized membrane protein
VVPPPPPRNEPRPEPERAPQVEPAGEDFTWVLWATIVVLVVGAAAVATSLYLIDQEDAVATPIGGTTIPPILEWD